MEKLRMVTIYYLDTNSCVAARITLPHCTETDSGDIFAAMQQLTETRCVIYKIEVGIWEVSR